MSKTTDEVKVYAAKIDTQTNGLGAQATRISETLKSLEDKLAEAGTVEEVRAILGPSVEALEKVGTELEAVGKKPEAVA